MALDSVVSDSVVSDSVAGAGVEPDVDVVVVGGGLAGVVAALRLRNPEVVAAFPVRVALVHAGAPGGMLAWGGRRAFHVAGPALKVGLADWQSLFAEAMGLGVVSVPATATAVVPVTGGFVVQTSAGTLRTRAVVAASGAFAMGNAGSLRPRDGVVTAFGALEAVRATLARAVARTPGPLVLFGPPAILELAAHLRALAPRVLVEPPLSGGLPSGALPPGARLGTLVRVVGEPAVSAVEYLDGAGRRRRLACRTVFVDFNAPMAQTRASDYLAPTRVSRPDGFVQVDGRQATGVPGLFAAGDATGGFFSVSKAIHEGNVAGLSALRHVHESAFGFTPGLYPFAHQPAGLTLSVFHRAPGVRLALRPLAPALAAETSAAETSAVATSAAETSADPWGPEVAEVVVGGPTGRRTLALTAPEAEAVRALVGRRGVFGVETLGAGLPAEVVRALLFSLVALGALRVGHPVR